MLQKPESVKDQQSFELYMEAKEADIKQLTKQVGMLRDIVKSDFIGKKTSIFTTDRWFLFRYYGNPR